MASVEQLRRVAEVFPDGPDFRWQPTEFGNWDTVEYVPCYEPRVTQARKQIRRKPRRSLNGPVTVRRIPPRD